MQCKYDLLIICGTNCIIIVVTLRTFVPKWVGRAHEYVCVCVCDTPCYCNTIIVFIYYNKLKMSQWPGDFKTW